MRREQKFAPTARRWQQLADQVTGALACGDSMAAYDAFAQLQDASTPWLLAIACRKGPPEEAEDLVVKAHTALFQEFQAGAVIGNVKALLGTIIRRQAVDALRQATNAPVMVEWEAAQFTRGRAELANPEALASLEAVENRSARDAVLNSVLEELPKEEREVLVARYLEGLTVTEAGGKLGKSPDQVKKLCQSALLRAQRLVIERGLRDAL